MLFSRNAGCCRVRTTQRRVVDPTLTNVNPEAAVMMVMMVMMVVVTMQVTRWDNNAVIAVVVVMMVVILRDLFSALRFCRSDARIIHLQRIQCIGNWLQKVAITRRSRVLCRFSNGGLCGAHCRQCSRSAQKPGDLLIHLFSSCPHGLHETIVQ
jgi:hypothetical protein